MVQGPKRKITQGVVTDQALSIVQNANALVAIKALKQENTELQNRVGTLETALAALTARVTALELLP